MRAPEHRVPRGAVRLGRAARVRRPGHAGVRSEEATLRRLRPLAWVILVAATPFALEQAYFAVTSPAQVELTCGDYYASPVPPRWVSLKNCQTVRGPVFFAPTGSFVPPAGARRYLALTPEGVNVPARVVWAYDPDPGRKGIRGMAEGGVKSVVGVLTGDGRATREKLKGNLNLADDFVIIHADWEPRPDLLGVYAGALVAAVVLLVLTRTRRAKAPPLS